MSDTKKTETAIEGLRKFMAWADSPESFPADATYEQPGFVCVDLITVDVSVRTLFNLRAEIDAKDAQLARMQAVAERTNTMESAIAIAVDHMNTQAREWQVAECMEPFSEFGLRDLAERLWMKATERERKAAAQLAPPQAVAEAAKRYREAEKRSSQTGEHNHVCEASALGDELDAALAAYEARKTT